MSAAANTTHLLWVGRWIEVVRVSHDGPLEDRWAWRFKSGRDAADWLRYDEVGRGDGQ